MYVGMLGISLMGGPINPRTLLSLPGVPDRVAEPAAPEPKSTLNGVLRVNRTQSPTPHRSPTGYPSASASVPSVAPPATAPFPARPSPTTSPASAETPTTAPSEGGTPSPTPSGGGDHSGTPSPTPSGGDGTASPLPSGYQNG